MTTPESPPPSPPPRLVFATLFTNLAKIIGLVIAVNETLLAKSHDATTLLVAAFMMAGAQGLESIVKNTLRP